MTAGRAGAAGDYGGEAAVLSLDAGLVLGRRPHDCVLLARDGAPAEEDRPGPAKLHSNFDLQQVLINASSLRFANAE